MSIAASVFQRVMADSFATLPALVQSVHNARQRKTLRGRVSVERGRHWMAKVLAPVASLPPTSSDTPLRVSIIADANGETWERDFNGHIMKSRLWASGSLLSERLGPVTLSFNLIASHQRLDWQIAGAKYFGVPLPARWFAGASATEQVIEGRYVFDVRAVLPIVGLLVHYRGWLAELE